MQKSAPGKLPPWFIIVLAAVFPGSGHVILGRPKRGLLLVLWIFVFGYITVHLAGPGISLLGRWSGGLAVWVLSVLEVYKLVLSK